MNKIEYLLSGLIKECSDLQKISVDIIDRWEKQQNPDEREHLRKWLSVQFGLISAYLDEISKEAQLDSGFISIIVEAQRSAIKRGVPINRTTPHHDSPLSYEEFLIKNKNKEPVYIVPGVRFKGVPMGWLVLTGASWFEFKGQPFNIRRECYGRDFEAYGRCMQEV